MKCICDNGRVAVSPGFAGCSAFSAAEVESAETCPECWGTGKSKQRLRMAIADTKKLFPKGQEAQSYWATTVAQRLDRPDACGSVFTGIHTPEQLEQAILAAEWEEYSHPAVTEGCEAFRASISGQLGVVGLVSLPGETEVTLDDRKGTGKVSAVVSGVRGETVDFTVLILGKEDGKEVVFTFHPGDPVRPSQVQAEPGLHSKKITAAQAIQMGMTTAKIV